ncbi:hypothetical protein [Micromonospora sp. NBC_01796]|uniref:hypothetical protein n=1 Tax=Micromonospora sp. NBC_01796 TaxID=2975987 RepID=UPI002DDAEFA5|nr:hypothetical protein [Micromonospora sp. NBC_01796]WSA88467.1 hypothetical protein OIE47_13160 [Micromonospora sp. NBC_01796]
MSALLRRALGVHVDPTQGDPVARRLTAAAARGDWPTVRDLFDTVTDLDDRSFYTYVVSCVPGVEKWLVAVIRDEPYDATALVLYGYRMTILAWKARTGYGAEHVTRDRWKLFFERLNIAEETLADVVLKDPDNVTAWYALLITSRGLQFGVDETRRRFTEVVSRHPGHLRAHQQMLQQLCTKWGGSDAEMFAFARESASRAPAGSPLGSLVAMAHLESWMRTGGNRRVDFRLNTHHFRKPEVRAELREVLDRSVRHPDYVRRPGWARVHNEFAMALVLAGERSAAADQFRAIGAHLTEIPWAYLPPSGLWTWLARSYRGSSYLRARTGR